jgi:hypothetical protein
MSMALRAEAYKRWVRKAALPHIPRGVWAMALQQGPL